MTKQRNLYEFTEQLSVYLKQNYNLSVQIQKYGSEYFYITVGNNTHKGWSSKPYKEVNDIDEDEIYRIVNWAINDKQ